MMRLEDIVKSIDTGTNSKIGLMKSDFESGLDSLMKNHFLELRRLEREGLTKISHKATKLELMKNGMFRNDARHEILSFKTVLLEALKREWIDSFVKSKEYLEFVSGVLDMYYSPGLNVVVNVDDKMILQLCKSRKIVYKIGDVGYGVKLQSGNITINKDISRIVNDRFEIVEGRLSQGLF